MKLSRLKALELLIKWKSEGTELFVLCDWLGFTLQATGRIRDLSSDRVEVAWEGGSVLFWFHIGTPDDVVFRYDEPVKAPPILERLHRLRYDCALDIWVPPKHHCVLYKVAFPSLIIPPEE